MLSSLEPLLLLVDDGLDNHGGGEDPRERHEEGEGARDGDDEAVLDVARVRHLLQGDPGQVGLVAPALQRDYRVLQHVLQTDMLEHLRGSHLF